MSLTVTSLAGAITRNQQTVKLTAFTQPSSGAGPRAILMVDGERMTVADATNSPILQVTRGDYATLASAHNTLAPVVYGLTSDFTNEASTSGAFGAPQYSYAVNGAISIPVVDQTIYFTKAGVLAMTLADPAADQTNTVKFVSLTANAHTITYSTGFYGGTGTVATFPGTIGGVFTIVARNGVWNAVATADDGVLIGT